jgi:hypothetical protein
MTNGDRVILIAVGLLLTVAGGDLAITQGSQYFWSQQHLHAQHVGSASEAAYGIALLMMGLILLAKGFREVHSKED